METVKFNFYLEQLATLIHNLDYAWNCKFCASEFHSKPLLIQDLQWTTSRVEHIGHTPGSLHELNRDHPVLTDCDHPTVKLI
jgi:hypothetical protein